MLIKLWNMDHFVINNGEVNTGRKGSVVTVQIENNAVFILHGSCQEGIDSYDSLLKIKLFLQIEKKNTLKLLLFCCSYIVNYWVVLFDIENKL